MKEHFVVLEKDKDGIVLSAVRHTVKNCSTIPQKHEVRPFFGGAYFRQNIATDNPFVMTGYEIHRVDVDLCEKCFSPENYNQAYIEEHKKYDKHIST